MQLRFDMDIHVHHLKELECSVSDLITTVSFVQFLKQMQMVLGLAAMLLQMIDRALL